MENFVHTSNRIMQVCFEPLAFFALFLFFILLLSHKTYKDKLVITVYAVVLLIMVGWRTYLGITSERYASIFSLFCIIFVCREIYKVNKILARFCILILCVISICKDLRYNQYSNYSEVIGKELQREVNKNKDIKIISFLDLEKNQRISFFSGIQMDMYEMTSKEKSFSYTDIILQSVILNLPVTSIKKYIILLECFSNKCPIISIPGVKLINSFFTNNQKKKQILVFLYIPDENDILFHGDSIKNINTCDTLFLDEPIFRDDFEKESLQNSWRVIQKKDDKLCLTQDNSIQGDASLYADSGKFRCFFYNSKSYKKTNKDYLLSFSTCGEKGSNISVLVGLWLNPGKNIFTFQIYSMTHTDNKKKMHYVILPKELCNCENNFTFYFMCKGGAIILDEVELRHLRVPLFIQR